MKHFLKGYYSVANPQKYRGNPANCIYRSSWERKMMLYLDHSTSILEWASEEIAIPYVSPADNSYHRYFPDFWIKAKDNKGQVFEALIEVKPESQVVEPQLKSNAWAHKKRFIKEAVTWSINQAKWKAAMNYCQDRRWKFIVLTEKTINAGRLSV